MRNCLAVVLLFSMAACGGDESRAPLTVEAEGLVGTWELRTEESTHSYHFAADGSYTEKRSGSEISSKGSWKVEETLLKLESKEGKLTTSFHRDGNRLILGAFLPQGKVDGVFGTWESRLVAEFREHDALLTESRIARLVLRPDHSGELELDHNGEVSRHSAQHVQDNGIELVVVVDDAEGTVLWKVLPLGNVLVADELSKTYARVDLK